MKINNIGPPVVAIFFAAAFPHFFGCANASKEQSESAEAATSNQGLPRIMVGNVPLRVEIVQTNEERMRGLMFRDKLPADQGMLFVFEESRVQSFWMRNTFIPLDIAFIDAGGRIIDIQRMEPLDESKSYVSPSPVPYVLEVNADWFAQHNIKVGEVVRF